jgi:hypothetical protein
MAVERSENGQLKKGSVLNPSGRPKGTGEKLEAMLAAATPNDAAAIMRRMVRLARSGDTRAAEFVMDRLFGKAAQALNLGGPDGGEIVVRVVYGDDGTLDPTA